jgi:hypothetical protein
MILTVFSCHDDKEEDDQLSLVKTPYFSSELKIDGYYYTLFEGKFQSISFFYENGIYLDTGGNANSNLDADNYVITQFINNIEHKSSKIWWGLFKINGDNIIYEKWYISGNAYKAYVRSGKIINDSTFNVTKSYRVVNGAETNVSSINETYYYRKFSPKPDNSNNFIP